MPEIDAEVELLIGVDAPKVIEPWQIINSQVNGPYAVKTLLGWMVNGPLSSPATVDEHRRPVASANLISIEQLKTLIVNQYHRDHHERKYEGKPEMSAEDHKFMQLKELNQDKIQTSPIQRRYCALW